MKLKKLLYTALLVPALACTLASCDEWKFPVSVSEDGYVVIGGEKTDLKLPGKYDDKNDDDEQIETNENNEQEETDDNGDVIPDENRQGLGFIELWDGTYRAEIDDTAQLTKIEIPNTYQGKAVTEVGGSLPRLLEELFIPDSVTYIDITYSTGSSIKNFTVDPNNTKYCSIDGNLYSKNQKKFIRYAKGKTDTSFAIPDGVTHIGRAAFFHCYNLTSITIPDSVTEIDDWAFDFCNNLKSIVIPEGVSRISDGTFSDCRSMESVTIPDSVTRIGDCAFFRCDSLKAAIFENPNGWQWSGSRSGECGSSFSSQDLSDPATAAQYLDDWAGIGFVIRMRR